MKRFLSLLVVCAAALSFAACQVTPEEPIVVEKDTERMIERALATPEGTAQEGRTLRETYGIPESLRFTETGADGKLTISVDAAVEAPDKPLPIVRVTSGNFSQEQMSALWSELVGDEEMFYTPGDMTKAEIEEAIIAARGYLEKAESDEDRARYQTQIDYFNDIYSSAPEIREKMTVDGTLQTLYFSEYGSDEKTAYCGILAANVDGTMRFSANNAYEDSNGFHDAVFEFSNSRDPLRSEDEPVTERREVNICDDTAPKNAAGLDLSPHAAAREVEAFLQKAKIPFAVAAATLTCKDGDYYYSFYCTRVVGDIPATFLLGEAYGKNIRTGVAETWSYEVLSIAIDDMGVQSVLWKAPLEINGGVVDNSALMPFADILAIFNKMMLVIYEFQAQGAKALTCDITDVRLETMRIAEQNSDKTGMLVPVWNFYGTRAIEQEDGSRSSTSRIILLCVNAVDGSVIDISKGY